MMDIIYDYYLNRLEVCKVDYPNLIPNAKREFEEMIEPFKDLEIVQKFLKEKGE